MNRDKILKMENLLLSVKVDDLSAVSKCELLTAFGDLKNQLNTDRIIGNIHTAGDHL